MYGIDIFDSIKLELDWYIIYYGVKHNLLGIESAREYVFKKVKENETYKHFKEHTYRIITIAKDSNDLKEKVVYQNVDTKEVWVRDYSEFISKVDKEKYPNVKQKYRFEKVEID